MFESAELGHKISNAAYARAIGQLRADLLDVQYEIKAASHFPVLILINGLDGAGKGETVNLLNAWMDPRHIETHAFPDPTEEERQRPAMWRYWRALPPKGKIGLLFGNWYSAPIVARAKRKISKATLGLAVADILHLEQMLVAEGVLIIKYWFHLTKPGQKKRLETLAADPLTRWRVTAHDWKLFNRYDKFVDTAEHVLRSTSTDYAPWTIIDGSDPNYRALAVGQHLLATLRQRLVAIQAPLIGPVPSKKDVKALSKDTARKINKKAAKTSRGDEADTMRAHKNELHRTTAPFSPAALDGRNLLNTLDLSSALADRRYKIELERWQGRLNLLSRHPAFRSRSVVLVFEGNDAAGKGGAIRRLTAALDARQYTSIPIAAPTEEERAQPYLWRFWRHLPRHGRFAIFDRSWYGRVLVERVEGFCSEADWHRAYGEINDFERQLAEGGAIVLKFWLAISPEEQLSRFKAREKTRFKRFKITPDDWRNREKWPLYEAAVCDMVERTHTDLAPWHLVAANDKNHARITILKTVCEALAASLTKKSGS